MEESLSTVKLRELAKQFLLDEFAAIWDIDASQLSEWLAEHSPAYATLTEEDEVDQILDDFTMQVDSMVRQAIDDFRIADEVEKA